MLLLKMLRGLFVALLLVSGLTKFADLAGFIAVVDTYVVLPAALLAPAATALASTEVGLALWLASGQQLVRASTAVLALHVVYLTWITVAFTRGLNIPNCGCFGVYFPRPLTIARIIEDLVLVVLAIWLLRSAAYRVTRSAAQRSA